MTVFLSFLSPPDSSPALKRRMATGGHGGCGRGPDGGEAGSGGGNRSTSTSNPGFGMEEPDDERAPLYLPSPSPVPPQGGAAASKAWSS